MCKSEARSSDSADGRPERTATEPNLNGKTILVTGGAGFIGSNLAMAIQRKFPNARVVVFDAFVLGHFRNLHGFQGECVAGDITQADDLCSLEAYQFDVIFHQAAISDTTVVDQQLIVRTNTNSLSNVIKLAQKSNACLVYASSAGTYGNSAAPNRVGYGEDPENVYGFSKLMMDRLALHASRHVNFPIVGLRYFNVYGPGERYKGKTASMIFQLAEQILSQQHPRLFKWGQQMRDFVYIEDVVEANILATNPLQSGVYNIGTGCARQFNEVVEIVAQELQINPHIDYVDNPWGFYQNHTQAVIDATRQSLNYQPRFSLETGIAAYIPEILRHYDEPTCQVA